MIMYIDAEIDFQVYKWQILIPSTSLRVQHVKSLVRAQSVRISDEKRRRWTDRYEHVSGQ